MKNIEPTILTQYANSPSLISYIGSVNSAIDPIYNINSFYDNVWNVSTAVGYGLDVWGRIVGVTRVLQIPGTSTDTYFGFEEGLPSYQPFDQAPFYTGSNPTTQNFVLSDDAFRLLIYAKAYSNIGGSSTYDYNQLLTKLFPGRGNAYVSNTSAMQSRLTFEFYLQPFEVSIIKYSGAIAPPTGVLFDVMSAPANVTFGFAEAGVAVAPFDQGTFFNGYL